MTVQNVALMVVCCSMPVVASIRNVDLEIRWGVTPCFESADIWFLCYNPSENFYAFSGVRHLDSLGGAVHAVGPSGITVDIAAGASALEARESSPELDVEYLVELRAHYDIRPGFFPDSAWQYAAVMGVVGFDLKFEFVDVITLRGRPAGDYRMVAEGSGWWIGDPFAEPRIVPFGEPFAFIVHAWIGEFLDSTYIGFSDDFYIDGRAHLTSLRILDSNGAPVSGYTYTTQSGKRLPLEGGVFVPEPAPAISLAVALFLLFAARWSLSCRSNCGNLPARKT